MLLLAWLWSVLMTWLSKRFKRPFPSSLQLFLSAMGSAYLFFPFLHYFASNPGRVLYITNSDNFFASNPLIQLGAYVLVLAMLKFLTKQRQQKNDDFTATLKLFLLLAALVIINFFLNHFLIV